MASRTTRSRSRNQSQSRRQEYVSVSRSKLVVNNSSSTPNIALLPDVLDQNLTGLDLDNLSLLQLKQRKLQDLDGQVPAWIRSLNPREGALAQAAAATLVFAQSEAGTAICISPDGLILTCSHCVAETQEEFERREDKWLLFASGCVAKTKCIVWDSKRDLALLQVTASQESHFTTASRQSFPFAAVGTSQGTQLLCIGHPGSEDLEASTSGIETDYDVLHISSGRFRGLDKDLDPQDNSEIGALRHDCWTYWGHSGAPLIAKGTGKLVGLHSSWDDETGMRRGVPLVAIRAFLDEHTAVGVEN